MKPLAGRRVLVTRPREQAAELIDRLAALGAEAIVAPLIRIVPPEDPEPLRREAERLETFDWVILSSVNAVEAFAGARPPAHISTQERPQFCAVGPATAAALQRFGLSAALVPAESRAEGIVAALAAQGVVEGRTFLIPRADIGRDHVARALTEAGATVTEVVAYRTVAEQALPEEARQSLAAGLIDVVTFTSASAVRSFASIVGAEHAPALLKQTVVAVIGPTTADEAGRAGMTVTIQPAEFTIPALINAIVRHYAELK